MLQTLSRINLLCSSDICLPPLIPAPSSDTRSLLRYPPPREVPTATDTRVSSQYLVGDSHARHSLRYMSPLSNTCLPFNIRRSFEYPFSPFDTLGLQDIQSILQTLLKHPCLPAFPTPAHVTCTQPPLHPYPIRA